MAEVVGTLMLLDVCRPGRQLASVTNSSTPFIMHKKPNSKMQYWLIFAQSFVTMYQQITAMIPESRPPKISAATNLPTQTKMKIPIRAHHHFE